MNGRGVPCESHLWGPHNVTIRAIDPGTYYAKVWVTAAGDAGYKPCTCTVTVKVVVT